MRPKDTRRPISKKIKPCFDNPGPVAIERRIARPQHDFDRVHRRHPIARIK
jgi:hypothetical protein